MKNSKIIDAVSLVLVCKDEVFYIVRQNFLKNFPGYFAFPGGKVDGDEKNTLFDDQLLNSFKPQLMHALCREAKEELGLDILSEVKKNNIQKIEELGCAITPDFNPYRFATYFYKIVLTDKPNFVVDENEAFEFGWEKPVNLKQRYLDGRLLAVPPMIKTISMLAKDLNTSKIDLAFHYDHENEVPVIESIYGVSQIMPLSNTLPPANRTNAFIIGDLLLDPSPKDEAELTKFINTIKKYKIKKIFLTHHHPDHLQYSNIIARQFNWPIVLSQVTKDFIEKKNAKDFFKGIEVQICKPQDIVTKSNGQDILVHAVPGHDLGQLALAPRNLNWFIAGDLFQGVGTVVVGDEEGDMAQYMKTLEYVIGLSPKCVFPSHGIALGGVNILQKTLEHRILREQQIKKLYNLGKSNQEILEEIYAEVDSRLWVYALKNIESHLVKIKNEL